MTIEYEWSAEQTDEHGDIIDNDFGPTLSELMTNVANKDREIVLVREDYSEHSGMDRYWAYVADGKLPEYFSDSRGPISIKVPKRFHTELAKYYSQQKSTQ